MIPRNVLLSFSLSSALVLGAASMASATTIDFDDVKPGSYASLSTQGYVLTSVTSKAGSCGPSGKRCVGLDAGDTVEMTLAAGGSFTLESLWVKLRGASMMNSLMVMAIGGAGNSFDITAAVYGRNNGQTIAFGDLFAGVESIIFSAKGNVHIDDIVANVSAVPVPAAGWALFAGLGGLVAARRRRKTA